MDRYSLEFWELHQRLGQCFEASRRADAGRRASHQSLVPPMPPPPLPLMHGASRSGKVRMKTQSHSMERIQSNDSMFSKIMPESQNGGAGVAPVEMESSELQDRQVSMDSRPDSPKIGHGIDVKREGHQAEKEKLTPVSPVTPPGPSDGKRDGRAMATVSCQSYCPVPLECWRRKASVSMSRSGALRKATTTVQSVSAVRKAVSVQTRTFALSPNGHFRNFWDFLGVVFLVLDAIVLPLQFVIRGFYELLPTFFVIGKVEVAYWCVDLILSFFTGYLHKGDLILNRRAIARHYLKSWFLPDLAVTAIDITLEATGAASGAASASASTRVLRLLRLFRVVRLGKLSRFASFLRDRFESEVAYTQFTLFLVIFGMLMLEHVVACGWFGIGSLGSETDTWLIQSEALHASFGIQYTASLRWAFSYLGIGGTNIEAVSELEGFYSVLVGLVSLIVFSTVISSMTSLVSTLQMKRLEETQQFGLLRRFIRVNKIPDGLGQRVTRFLHFTYHERIANSEDPYILGFLSKSLQAELRLARYHEQLSKLPFLADLLSNSADWSLQEGHVVQNLARHSVSVLECAEDDVVFCYGTDAVASYSVMQGRMLYLQNGERRNPPSEGWIAEMPLWTQWTHLGDLVSANFSRVMAIHAKEFCQVICESPSVQVQGHAYAVRYVEQLSGPMQLSDLPPEATTFSRFARQQSLLSLNLEGKCRCFMSVLRCGKTGGSSARVSP